MTPTKPPKLRAVEAACVAQQRLADALMGLAAYEGCDLDGALKDLTSAMGRIQEAKLAIRAAIIERDGEARFPAATITLPPERTAEEDKAAQRFVEKRRTKGAA